MKHTLSHPILLCNLMRTSLNSAICLMPCYAMFFLMHALNGQLEGREEQFAEYDKKRIELQSQLCADLMYSKLKLRAMTISTLCT